MSTYASIAEFQKRTANANLGVAGSVVYDDDSLTEALTAGTDIINDFLDISLNTTLKPGVLRNINIDLAIAYVLQSRHMKEKNEVEGVSTYYVVNVDLTEAHKSKLRRVKRKIYGNVWNYSTKTGRMIK